MKTISSGEECKLQRLFSPEGLDALQQYSAEHQHLHKQSYYHRVTKKVDDIHLQFANEHAHDSVQRISLSSRQGQQHPLVVASVGNPDQPNNQNFTLEKQTFSPTKVKIGVSGTHHPQLVSRLTHMTPALKQHPSNFQSIVVIVKNCFGFFDQRLQERDIEKCGLGKSSSSSFLQWISSQE